MQDDYNLYPLHVFRMVARHGSVTNAAQELCISQPAVSSHVKALEARYGTRLFERTPRGMLLTAAGELLAKEAGRVFALLSDIAPGVGAVGGTITGEVTVGASSTPGAYLLPKLVSRFQKTYPDARAHLTVGDSAEVVQWLLDFRAPLAVVGAVGGQSGITCEPIAGDELRLTVCPNDSLCTAPRITAELVAGRTLFIREHGSSTRSVAESLLANLLGAFGHVVEMTSTDAIKKCVAAGLGVAVLSSWGTELEERAGLLCPVSDVRMRYARSFYLARRADRVLVGVASALWGAIAKG